MADKFLGWQIDIHWWWADLLFPHHENEIAQSEAYLGKQFSKYWIHNWLVNVDWQKMGKSLGNFTTIKDSLSKYAPDVIRYTVLSSNVSSSIDFNDRLYRISEKRMYYYYRTLEAVDELISNYGEIKGQNLIWESLDTFDKEFISNMNDNFNFAKVISKISNMFTEINALLDSKRFSQSEKVYTFRIFRGKMALISKVMWMFDEIPSAFLGAYRNKTINEAWVNSDIIEKMINERLEAKSSKDYIKADRIRDELKSKWILLSDWPTGTTWDIEI